MPELILFGVSFRTAPVAVRETLTFTPAESGELLRRAAAELTGIEALVLSTCNRTEFYLAGGRGSAGEDGAETVNDVVGRWHRLLKQLRPTAPAAPEDCHFYERRGADAFRHLARLACGLESAILGDAQLLSQLRVAVALSQEHGTMGRELNQATAAALRVGRAARSETRIAAGSAGIGSAVAATVGPEARRVAVLGAGEAARSIARHLAKRGIVDLTYCNRTADRAERLAVEIGGRAHPWSEVDAVLEQVDVAAVATSAPGPVLEAETLDRVARRRQAAGRGPLVVIDAGFPPQVTAPPIASVRLIPLDAIREGEAEALSARRSAVPDVEAMVEESVAAWSRWRSGLTLSGTIRRLQEQAEDVTRELAGELVARGMTPGDAERILRRPLRRLLHEAVSELRATEASAA